MKPTIVIKVEEIKSGLKKQTYTIVNATVGTKEMIAIKIFSRIEEGLPLSSLNALRINSQNFIVLSFFNVLKNHDIVFQEKYHVFLKV
jgi:hypothetical protein